MMFPYAKFLRLTRNNIKEPLIKSEVPAIHGCIAKFDDDKSLNLRAKQKSHFLFCVLWQVQDGLVQSFLKFTCVNLRHLRIIFCLLSFPLAAQEAVQRFPYFGDLHVHTSWSLDSYATFHRAGPREAYRFALGEEIVLSGDRVVRIDRPLDFAAVTEHAEYLGELPLCTDESSAVYALQICRDIRNESRQPSLINSIFREFIIRDVLSPDPQREPELCGEDNARCLARAKSTWRELQDIAHEFNSPGVFTTFVGYEWTGNPHGNNLHRNVIYGNGRVPALPISIFEANTPEKLWRQLHETCAAPCKVLAIPHNSNQSNGRQFPALREMVPAPGRDDPVQAGDAPGQALDDGAGAAGWAALRARTEPLVEIFQAKGGSECHTGVGTEDELCLFEKLERRPLCGADPDAASCAQVCGSDGSPEGCIAPGNYVRNALKLGLEFERQLDVNPYKLGFIGSTDTHNGTPGGTDESNYQGHHGFEDGTPARRALTPEIKEFSASREKSSGGLVGVWAEQNTRAAIFAALQRRETFATSGTRIAVRFFAGWDYPDAIDMNTDLAALGYARGVSMGGDLPSRPGLEHTGNSAAQDNPTAPRFILLAMKDPEGVNLQRMQVIKGWLEQDEAREQVYDVACADGLVPDPVTYRCPGNGAGVNLNDCSVSAGKGAAQLKALWQDPDFNRDEHTFYYVRVLENPSCRWSTWEAIRENTKPFDDVDLTIQERAWSSPIWYGP